MTPQPEFIWAQEVGNIGEKEMYRTFNMGVGMIIAASAEVAKLLLSWLNQRMNGCQIVGTVVNNGHKVTHAHPDVVFEHY